jgi:hypothetical protein
VGGQFRQDKSFMGLKDIFKKEKPSKDLKLFADITIKVFNELMHGHGFKLLSKKVEQYFCTIIYVKGDNYVKIFANIHWHDYPSYYNVILGDGKTDWPDNDWNSVAIWHLKKHIDPASNAKEYSLLKFDGIEHSLDNAKNELEKYGADFLKGNLDLLKKVRAEVNQQREPYKIHTPQGDGSYKTTYDKTSEGFKNKNS